MEESKFNRKRKNAVVQYRDVSGKVPPQAIDFEKVVLGQIILEYSRCWDSINYLLSPEVFYQECNQLIYTAIEALAEEGAPVDMLTVTNKLRVLGTLKTVGGAYYVTGLCSQVISSDNISHYAGIIYQKYILRELIKHSNFVNQSAFEDSTDVFNLLDISIQLFGDVQHKTSLLKRESGASKVDSVIEDVLTSNDSSSITIYETQHKKFNEVVGLSPNEILLLAGPAGHGKTRFLISIIKDILTKYSNISVHWFSFEDPSEKIIRCFAANEMLITEKIIKGKGAKKLNDVEKEGFIKYMDSFRKFDIEFVTDSKFINQVNGMFQTFCRKRPDRFNICIIDNLLLLEDNSNDRDDIIAKELVKMRKATNGLILPVHHFNDEQMDKDQKKAAYRPRLVHLKGRESYRRACTQIILINKVGEYPDLVSEYRGIEDILKYLFILEIAKNRDGTANEDNSTLLRYWSSLDFLKWKEI